MKWMFPSVLTAALLASIPTARAQQYEALAEGATSVADGRALAALFWAATAKCPTDDDLLRRQCEGVKAARADINGGRVYRMKGDAGALVLGAPAGGVVPVTLRSCLAGVESVDLAGERYFVVGNGGLSVNGGALVCPDLAKSSRTLPGEAQAKSWLEKVAPSLRVELLFKVPAKPVTAQSGALRVFVVDIVGYRLTDPCDGQVVVSSPQSGPVPARKDVCEGALLEVETPPETPPEEVKPPEPQLPDRLTPGTISSSMSSTRAEVNACFARYGIRGTARVDVEILGAGTVNKVVLKGDFEDTPTGDCILKAVKATTFPPFQRESMTITNYPFILR